MKLNFAYPATGCQKLIDIEDEKVVRPFYEKRMGQEIEIDFLGEEYKNYVVRISGGNDKQGFPMKQGVLTNNRVRLLLSKGHSCYRPRRDGERKRKSVRGCIVDSNLSVLSLVVLKKGDKEIEGLTDKTVPRRLGPKRASKIRKLFNLEKSDDVRRYVIRRQIEATDKKKARKKGPKIQRLITPCVLQHRRHKRALKKQRQVKNKKASLEYAKLLVVRRREANRKKSLSRASISSSGKAAEKKKMDVKELTKAVKATSKVVAGKLADTKAKAAPSKKAAAAAPKKVVAAAAGKKAAPVDKKAKATKEVAKPAKAAAKPAAAPKKAAAVKMSVKELTMKKAAPKPESAKAADKGKKPAAKKPEPAKKQEPAKKAAAAPAAAKKPAPAPAKKAAPVAAKKPAAAPVAKKAAAPSAKKSEAAPAAKKPAAAAAAKKPAAPAAKKPAAPAKKPASKK